MVALVSVRLQSNNLTSNFIHHDQHKMLLTFTLTHYTVMSSTSNIHHFSSSHCFFEVTSHSLTHPALTSPSYTHFPPSHYLCSLTIYNTTQGAHGLDGRPGPVVSGTSPTLVPSLSHPSPDPLLSAPPPLQLQLAWCLLVMSACLITSHICSVSLIQVALWVLDCWAGLSSEDTYTFTKDIT